MRELKLEEKIKVMKKLEFFIGDNVSKVVNDENVLILHECRVLLMDIKIKKTLSSISRDELVVAGTVIGRFTKTEKFRLLISSIHVLAPWAISKVWIKTSAEMNYLYGNNSLKSHIFRTTENIPINSGVFVFNQNDVPLGFGVTALKPEAFNSAKGHAIAVLRQTDGGEYLRNERLAC